MLNTTKAEIFAFKNIRYMNILQETQEIINIRKKDKKD